jgi:phosphate transport system substrate-binding protein
LADEEMKLGLEIVEYARTPLVLAVGASNPLSSVRRSEFIRILRGDAGIRSGSQQLRPILRPVSDAEAILARNVFPEIGEARSPESNATIALTSQDAADLIERVAGAIGPSTLGLMRSENRKMKALSLDGVAPSTKNITSGSYPLVMNLYLVTKPKPSEPIRKFVAFVQSEPGKRLLEESGNYVGERKK